MFMLDLSSGVPIYEQLKNKTLELIYAGVLQQGEQMPSVRSLAKELGVNPNTIQKAYQDMESDGIIFSVTGKGSFVASKKDAQQQIINPAKEKFKKSVHEAKIYGVSLDDAIQMLRQVYKEDIEV